MSGSFMGARSLHRMRCVQRERACAASLASSSPCCARHHASSPLRHHARGGGGQSSSPRTTVGPIGAAVSESPNGSLASPAASKAQLGTKKKQVGVLLLNLGGPETLDDVQPFLYNLFADPDILRLPPAASWAQPIVASLISTFRAPVSKEGYAAIGGGAPLRQTTEQQAEALEAALELKDQEAKVYVAMRYWHPFTEEAIAAIKRDGVTDLVVLPLYPQFSISTSGSSLRLLEKIFQDDGELRDLKHTVIPSWYQRAGYIEAMANLIVAEWDAADWGAVGKQGIHLFFSAHGVPKSYVNEAGDPYKEEMEQTVELIMRELEGRGVAFRGHTLAYQSRVGPVEWLEPYTEDTIPYLASQGIEGLLVVPISFVSEHIETLEEIDVEYKELAMENGIVEWRRVPALGCDDVFIKDLSSAVIEALPYVDTSNRGADRAASDAVAARDADADADALVPMGSVNELLDTYDGERRILPLPEMRKWEWGWTRSAELWNGRLAMLALTILLAFEYSTGKAIFLVDLL